MICYRDMSFCSAPCANRDCFRNYNDDVQRNAERWWGSKAAPIAFMDFSDGCAEYQPINEAKP